MKYYVVTDIHGFLLYLERALEEKGFFNESEPYKLIVCGDLLDRGKEARELVDFMLRLADEDKLIYVYGNHEELFYSCLQEIARGEIHTISCGSSHHYRNGTWDTMLQLSEMSAREAIENPNELVRRVMSSDFYRRLLPMTVDYFETAHYVFTHGWIPCRREGFGPFTHYEYDPNWRAQDSDGWHFARWVNGMDMALDKGIVEPSKTIVCGHWHTSYAHSIYDRIGTEWGDGADYSPFYDNGIIALDSRAVVSGFLNCIVIEDD